MFQVDDTIDDKVHKQLCEKNEVTIEPNDVFDVFLQDFCKETLKKQKLEQSDKPWDAYNLLPQKSPVEKEKLAASTTAEVKELLSGLATTAVSGKLVSRYIFTTAGLILEILCFVTFVHGIVSINLFLFIIFAASNRCTLVNHYRCYIRSMLIVGALINIIIIDQIYISLLEMGLKKGVWPWPVSAAPCELGSSHVVKGCRSSSIMFYKRFPSPGTATKHSQIYAPQNNIYKLFLLLT